MTESTAIVLQTEHAIMPAMDISMATARYDMMKGFVKSCLVEGQDFGKVPGTKKDTLLKPGAEKLMSIFGLAPSFESVQIVQDWTGETYGEPFIYYWFKCKLSRGDQLVGEGEGSCNSWESKYRYRWVPESEIPAGMDTTGLQYKDASISEWKFAVDKAETSGKYGKPAEYWNLFTEAQRQGTLQVNQEVAPWNQKSTSKYTIPAKSYRMPNPDVAGAANTILKMAQKRALVAATLITTNASDFFTQDLEDMDLGDVHYEVIAPQPTTNKFTAPVIDKPDVVEIIEVDKTTVSVKQAQNRAPESLAEVEPLPVEEPDEIPFELNANAEAAIVEPPIAAPHPVREDLAPFVALGKGQTDYEFSESAGNLIFDVRGRDYESERTMTKKQYGFLTSLVCKAINVGSRSDEWKNHGPQLWATLWSREINKDNTPGQNVSELIDWLNPDGEKYAEDVAASLQEIWSAVLALHDEVSLWEPEHGVKEAA